ncbi:MAG: XRE family transcriptional regulator [Actinomycetota bacterium]|nr:XRE family transcriptional regulator [Actinomycetota bacterium]
MIGERVRHVRDFCGLTQTALADLAGLSQSQISDIEAGRTAAKPEDVARIAKATAFPYEFFHLGALPDLPDGYFRRLKRGKARVTRQVRAQARQIVELVQWASAVVELPPICITPVRSVTDIEEVAAQVREDAGVGYRDPIPNLTRAVERAGVVVAGFPGDIPDHYGFSAWPDFGLGGRPIVVFAHSDPGDRQRYTIAHELAHLVLHSPRRDDELDPDKAEKEANRLASALLLPYDAAIEAMKPPLTLTTLAHVKATFGASIATCAHRALDLGLITEPRFVSLRKQMTSRGWHRHEPVEVQNEHPVLIRKILEVMGQGGSIAEKAESVKMPAFAFRALAASN